MGRREAAQAGLAVGGEPDSRDAAVPGIGLALDQPGGHRPVHELDSAVVTQQQIAGQIGDGRILAARVALDRDHELVLGGGKADRPGLAMTPVQETAEAGAERQQVLVLGGEHPGGQGQTKIRLATVP